MLLQSITLHNYRSFASASFEFGPDVSIIVGPNASGKTNLLEAVSMLTGGSSFRVSDKDLVAHQSDWARIDGIFSDTERTVKLQAGDAKIKKTFDIDGTVRSRLGFDYTIPTVLFEPDDMRIIYGSPERRRRFIDDVLGQSDHGYKTHLVRYQKLLRQRNALLKSPYYSADQLFAWNIMLAKTAEELVVKRAGLIDHLNGHVTDIYNSIADRLDSVQLEYTTDTEVDNYTQKLVKKLENSVRLDRERGFTSHGPHRDDLQINVHNKPALLSASRGEARTLMLALKIMEVSLLEHVRGTRPLLLLDDVFSELDGTRRRLLTTFLRDKQSIITTTDADIIGKSFTKLATIISL